MTRLRQVLIYAALSWALIAPCIAYVSSHGGGDSTDVVRCLQALASGWPGEPQQRALLAELAREAQCTNDRLMMIVVASSGIVVVLCLMSMIRINRESTVT